MPKKKIDHYLYTGERYIAVYEDGSSEPVDESEAVDKIITDGTQLEIEGVTISGKKSSDQPNWFQNTWAQGDSAKNEQARQSWDDYMPKNYTDYSQYNSNPYQQQSNQPRYNPKVLQSKAIEPRFDWQRLPPIQSPETYDGPQYDRDARIMAGVMERGRKIHPYSSGSYIVRKGDNLIEISKKFGVKVQDLIKMNKLNSINSLQIGQVLKVSPERDFTNNPRGRYSNPDKSEGLEYSVDNMFSVGLQFLYPIGSENMIISSGKSLDQLREWDQVKKFVEKGANALWKNGELIPGETYEDYYTSPNMPTWIQRQFNDGIRDEKIISPQHIIGSFGFSMRVNADRQSATVAVYNANRISTLSDNKLGNKRNVKNRKSIGRNAFSTQYIRFIWKIYLAK